MDKFDDIWKDRFNEEELPVDDWNTPDDEVWKGIVPHVEPIKERRRRWWWFLFGAGSMLLLLAGLIFYPVSDNNKSTSSKQEDNLNTLTTSNNAPNIVDTGVVYNDESTESSLNSTNSIVKSENLSVNVSPIKSVSQVKHNNTNTKNIQIQKITSVPQNSFSNTSITDANDTASPEDSHKFLENTALIASSEEKTKALMKINFSQLPSLELAILKMPLLSNDLPSLEMLDIDFPKEKMFSIGFSTGIVFWKHRISETYTSDLSPFDFNYDNSWGWQTSLNAKIGFNQYLEGMIGIGYEQISTQSGHNSILTYNTDNEDFMNPLNGYALSLATPYGLSAATFNLLRNENLGGTTADLLVDFHSSHIIKNVSIPVGLNIFPFGKKNAIVPSFSVGIGTNYLASISNRIQSIDTNHGSIQYDESGSSTFVSPVLEKWHFDYRLGLGVTYQLNSNSSLNLNYNWSRGINPIFKLENYNTRVDRHHLSIGLNTKLF